MSIIWAELQQISKCQTIQLLPGLRITFGESLGKWRYIVELGSVELGLNHIMGYTWILTSLQPSDRWQRWSPQRLKGNEQQTHISKYITIFQYIYLYTSFVHCSNHFFVLQDEVSKIKCACCAVSVKNKVILPPSHLQLTEKIVCNLCSCQVHSPWLYTLKKLTSHGMAIPSDSRYHPHVVRASNSAGAKIQTYCGGLGSVNGMAKDSWP